VLLALVLANSASALSCVRGGGPARVDVAFVGVALSGQEAQGALVSPARFAVVRYLEGTGPRVVEAQTALTARLDGTVAVLGGELQPRPGELWRIRGLSPAHRQRLRAGDVVDGGRCRGSRRLARHAPLRALGPPVVVAARGGFPRWRAQVERGFGRLRCVALRRVGRPGRHRECGWTRTRGLATTLTLLGGPRHPTTVVTALSPALRRLTVAGVEGPRVARARRGAAVLVFAGYVDPSRLRVTAVLAGGERRRVPTGAAERVRAADPDGGRWTWSARTRSSGGRVCVGFQQDPPRIPAPPFFTGDVTCAAPVRGARYAWAPALPAIGVAASRVVLYGVAGSRVAAVQVIAAGRLVDVPLAARGRAFLAVFPASVQFAASTLVVRLRDGRVVTARGPRTGVLG